MSTQLNFSARKKACKPGDSCAAAKQVAKARSAGETGLSVIHLPFNRPAKAAVHQKKTKEPKTQAKKKRPVRRFP